MKPLTYFCDTPHTQQLMGMFGDRLQQMERADLIDFVTVFSAACNNADDEDHSEFDLQNLASYMQVVTTDHVDSILKIMDGFERSNELNLLFGLAAMLADRSEVGQ